MKQLLYIIPFILLLGCNKDNGRNLNSTYLFDYSNINELNLTDVDNFWSEGIAIDTSYYMGANFENQTGFIGGIRLYSGNGKEIWISVFETREDAIEAMGLKINDVACVIFEGNPEDFENKWWYTNCMAYRIFDNQYNTIVEVELSSNATIEIVKAIELNVASEINHRIKELSNPVSDK